MINDEVDSAGFSYSTFDFSRSISRCFFFCFPVCARSVGKAKMRKNVSRQYVCCVSVCVCVLVVDQMIMVLLFLRRVTM